MAKKLSIKDIRLKIKQAYPDYKIKWDTSNFKNLRSRCKFTIEGKEFHAIVDHVTRGAVKFRGLNKNVQIKSADDILAAIIKKTKEKHPNIKFSLDIDRKSYVDTHTKCYLIFNQNKIMSSNILSNLMKSGLSLKTLGLKKKAPFKHDSYEILRKIQEG